LPAARLAVSTVDPWFLTFGRAVVAGAVALAILIATRRRLPPRSVVTSLAIAALFVVFGFPLFSTFAMRTVPAAHGGVVLGILPLATAASAAVLAHERASLGFRLVGALGAALVVGFAFRHGGSSSLAVGDLLLLASIASSALGYTLSGRLSLSMPGWEVICWALVLSLPFALIGAIVFWPAHPAAVPATAWMAFL
jgi:drug/metabolite transporter (DMT)-like permease